MMSYFTLEVYVHDVVVAQGVFGSELAYRQDAQAPYALSFQFLDYPLLLVYAGGEAWTGVSGPIDVNSTVYNFSSGKSCVFQADAGELAFLVEQVMGMQGSMVRCADICVCGARSLAPANAVLIHNWGIGICTRTQASCACVHAPCMRHADTHPPC